MDLNEATRSAQCGRFVRDDATMRHGWTVRWVGEEKLLYYFTPRGDKAHKILFSDAMRASYQWRTVPANYPRNEE
jgi:hypothetical protein